MTTRNLILLMLVLISGISAPKAIGQSGAGVPESFETASPTKGLWKGWPIGTTVTYRLTLNVSAVDPRAMQFSRLMLVGRSKDGTAVVARYDSEQEAGPWQFSQSTAAEISGSLHQAGIHQISERPDKLLVDGKPVDCVVRVYTGTLENQWHQQVMGEEWTVGPDGPLLKSSASFSFEITGQKFASSEAVTCTGQQTLKIGTQETVAYQTEEQGKNGDRVIGSRTRRYWSEKVPGWLVCRRVWGQPDEQQPPNIEDEVIAFGSDAALLDRYVKTDRPPEAEKAKMWTRLHPTTRPASAPAP
jgi:hypothetical protein